MEALGHAVQTATTLTFTDLLVNRIRTTHNKPEFDLQQWLEALRRSKGASHVLMLCGLGIKPELARRAYQKNLNKKLSEDSNVMCDRDQAATAKFKTLVTQASYNHIINVGYDGRTVSTTRQDPAALWRFYSHLWWNTEGV